MTQEYRIGQGMDVHSLAKGHKLWLGGIRIPFEKGCIAHSDGDSLIHAICDALLGALALGDIGQHFPDTDEAYREIDSKELLKHTYALVREHQYTLHQLDATICLERPKLMPYLPEMRKTLAAILDTDPSNISIKATTTEKLGFTGRGEGVAAFVNLLLVK